MDKFLAGAGLQGVVEPALLPDGRGALRTHLPPAERARAVRRKDLRAIGELEQLVMEARATHRGTLRGGVAADGSGWPDTKSACRCVSMMCSILSSLPAAVSR